jgi:predicted nucleic acid-binding protein
MPSLEIVPLNEAVAIEAARLQQKTPLRIGDAIHLATALQQQATLFLTNDKQLAKIAKSYLNVQTLDNTNT